MSQRMTCYTRWSFNYPPGTVIPDGFVYGISYALFGIDSLSGYVLASRAPAGAWEPGAYLTREVQIPEETQPWFCSQETRPLLIMTEHGLGLLSKRYLPACGLGLLIHFHVPGKRGAAAVNRGLLQTDWIVSESVRAMGAGRCDAETYQVLTEAAYELSERLPALFPQPDRQTVRLRDVSDCICSMAAAIGCVAQEAPTRDGNTDRDQNRQVFCSRPRVWEAFLLYGLSLAWRMAADGGSLTFSLNAPGALTTEMLSVRLDMELEYVRSAARAVCASSGVLNGDSGAFLTGLSLPDSRIRLQRRDSQVRFGKSRSRPGQPAAGAPAPDAGDDHAERSRRGLADEPALQRNRTVPVLTGQTSLTGSSGAHTRQSGAGRHPAFGHPRRTAHTFAPCVNDW